MESPLIKYAGTVETSDEEWMKNHLSLNKLTIEHESETPSSLN